MNKDELRLEKLGALYSIFSTLLILLSQYLSGYPEYLLYIVINKFLIVIIPFVLLKAVSLVSRIYRRPLKKDLLRIYLWIDVGVILLLTCLQIVIDNEIYNNIIVAVLSGIMSLPMFLGVFCLYIRELRDNSKLRFCCWFGFGISLVYLCFKIANTIMNYLSVPQSNLFMMITSKYKILSLLMLIYFLTMSVLYYVTSGKKTKELKHAQEN